MYRGLPFAVVVPCLNEEENIVKVIRRLQATGIVDEIVVADDGSTDRSMDRAKREGATVLSIGKSLGVGAALRRGLAYIEDKYPVVVIIAGNDKDNPEELPRLLRPLVEKRAEFVQGSRYLPGGGIGGAMPFYRRMATRIHPWAFSLATGCKLTESTNGYRAFRTKLLADPNLDLNQPWLDRYELEPYLFYKALTLGYSCIEVPVTKTYPPRGRRYTRMPAVVGWWSILRPLFLLRFGIRQ